MITLEMMISIMKGHKKKCEDTNIEGTSINAINRDLHPNIDEINVEDQIQ